MTRAQARASLARWLGNRTELVDSDYDMFLDDGLADLTTRRYSLYSLEKVGATITSVASQASYAKPADAFTIMYIEDTTNQRVLRRFGGEFTEYLDSKQSAVSADSGNPPTNFIEYGNQFFVGPTIPVDGSIVWVPYYYQRASWGSGLTDEPAIEKEWHYPTLLVARIHAAQELSDPVRLQLAHADLDEWLGLRDTAKRMARRIDVPVGGVKPHAAWIGRR
jgi:hypothetical protein